jgi:hypothetical protein
MRQLPVSGEVTGTTGILSPLMRPSEAAALGLTLAQIRALRTRGTGPVFYRIGSRSVRYSRTDVHLHRAAFDEFQKAHDS